MPNWVKTVVKTSPNIMKDLMQKYSKENAFSFDKVIPMPEDLNVEKSSRGEDGLMLLYLESNNDIPKNIINEVYQSLNPFHRDIYKDSRFLNIVKNYEPNKNKLEYQQSIELAKKYISNYEKYGHADWYEWCCDKWGTKWDLSRFHYNKDTMIFETAWGFAGNVILELSKKYPEERFFCKFADEGNPEISGIVEIQDGEVMEERYGLTSAEIEEIWDIYLDNPEEEQDEIDIEK